MRRIAFLLASIYCLAACNNEVIYPPEYPLEGTKPQIELFFTDNETVNVYSSATLSENMIDTIWVIAFNSVGAKQWVEPIEGSRIPLNGYASQLLPQLSHEPVNGQTIVCIANVDTGPDTTNVTYATINDCFTLEQNGYYYGTEFLPMYGEFEWNPANGTICEMTRAVAKIQVQMGTSVSIADSVGNFSAENVSYWVHNGGRAGFVKPLATIQGKPNSSVVVSSEKHLLLQNQSITEMDANVYLYEYPSSNTTALGATVLDSVFHADRQFLILHKANAPGDTTYYRLDFYNPVTRKFLDTKRNHHYLFTINRVRSEGYRTLAQAINNPGSNIEYDIIIKDEATRTASNGQFGIVITDLLPFIPGGKDTLALHGIDDDNTFYNIVNARIQMPDQMTSWYSSTRREIQVRPSASFELNPLSLLPPPPTAVNVSVKIKPGTLAGTVGELIFYAGNVTHRVYFEYLGN